MQRSNTQTAIAPALVKALAEFTGVAKDSKNPHFKNDYASLEAVIDTARPILAKHGLAFMQGLGEYAGGVMSVSTLILHDSGEWIETTSMMPVSKTDPQGTASASTYNRRYSLMSMLGLPAVDDDGNEASKAPQKQAGARKSAADSKRDGDHEKIKEELAKCPDLETLGVWGAVRLPYWLSVCPTKWEDPIRDEYDNRRNAITEAELERQMR